MIETDSPLVISALTEDAAAGGLPLRARPTMCSRAETSILDPCYGRIGGLYGSEYSYLLPRPVGER